MDQYRTEEEQVEAIRRWWDENGRSTLAAIIIAVSLAFGYQTWKGSNQNQQERASDLYQAMLQTVANAEASPAQQKTGIALAEQLKTEFGSSTYAQFAALHLARVAVENNDLVQAEAQLRWVLGQADKGSDNAQLAQLRLARVLAASGDNDQALAILDSQKQGTYQASYALARGDILLGQGKNEDARLAYSEALALTATSPGQVNLATLQQKLQSLNPVPQRELDLAQPEALAPDVVVEEVEDAEAEAEEPEEAAILDGGEG